MKKTIILLFLLSANFIILAGNNTGLISKFFSAKETKQLTLLTHDFDQHIISAYGKSGDLNLAWQTFFKELKSTTDASEIKDKINLTSTEQENMLKKLGTETLRKIWNLKSLKEKGKKQNELLSLKYKSNYSLFLEDLSRENNLIKEYRNSIEIAGDISPNSVANLIIHQSELDLSDPDIRLFLTIHYLSINKEPLKII